MKQCKTIVIIPTYNNPKTIQNVVDDVLTYYHEVIVIDDGSDVKIESFLTYGNTKNVYIVRHAQNEGKGQAIISGTKKAASLGYTHVLSMDGDGQHLASQAEKLIQHCCGDEIIIGVRNFTISHVPLGSKFGRWFSNFWAELDTKQKITDSLSGYRLYPISILDLPIKTKRFDWEMEVLVRHADSGKKIDEVNIECYYPLAEERVSHFRNFEDTMTIVWVHLQLLSQKFVHKIVRILRFWK